jgi:hypothetical protein
MSAPRRALVLVVLLVVVVALGACSKRESAATSAQPGQPPGIGCTVRSAADVAYITDKACPTPSDLVAKKRLTGSVADPWGRDFLIDCDGQQVRVRSVGPDGKDKTADDVTYDAHACNVLH